MHPPHWVIQMLLKISRSAQNAIHCPQELGHHHLLKGASSRISHIVDNYIFKGRDKHAAVAMTLLIIVWCSIALRKSVALSCILGQTYKCTTQKYNVRSFSRWSREFSDATARIFREFHRKNALQGDGSTAL